MNYNELYQNYFLHIRVLVHKIIQNWDDSEDIAQDVFLTTFINRKDLGGDISFLYHVAKSKSIDYMRRRKYRISYINAKILEYDGIDSEIETNYIKSQN